MKWRKFTRAKRHDKEVAHISSLFNKEVTKGTPQDMRDGLDEFIKKAKAERDIDALALLAGWFVLASEDATIERFKNWVRTALSLVQQEPPSNGKETPE